MGDHADDLQWLWGPRPGLGAWARSSGEAVSLRFVLGEDGLSVAAHDPDDAVADGAVRTVNFYVPGLPIAQGSKVRTQYGMRESNDKTLKPWRATVAFAAAREVGEILDGPVSVLLSFRFPRPKAHYGTGKNSGRVKLTAPHLHTVKPDIDKLQRAVFDALTNVVWKDDSQVCVVRAEKIYGDSPGVEVTIREHD